MKFTGKIIFIIFIILLFFLSVFLLLRFANKRNKTNFLTISGVIQAGEVKFGSRQSGRIKKIYAQEGELLKSGQKILELENNELLDRKDSMKATVLAQKAKLDEFASGYRQEEISSQAKSFELTKAELDRAEKNYSRVKSLFEKEIITRDKLEEAEKNYKVALKSQEKASEELKKLKTGYRKEQVNREYNLLKSYEAQLSELNNSSNELFVISPCDCELSEFILKPGNLVSANQVLGVLVDNQDMWVEAYLPEEFYGLVKTDDLVEFSSFSYPKEKFTGKISFIALKSEFTPRNIQTIEERKKQVFKVKVRINNTENKFRPGMDLNLYFEKINKNKN